jgi:hypothetical protein
MLLYGWASRGEELENGRDSSGNVGEGMYKGHIVEEDCLLNNTNEVLQCG